MRFSPDQAANAGDGIWFRRSGYVQEGSVQACMYMVRFYLPLRDNTGKAFPARMFRLVEAQLSHRFGGVTAHLHSPASGMWRDGPKTHVDDVVSFEVLVGEADTYWWNGYREKLQHEFRQKRILLILQPVDVI